MAITIRSEHHFQYVEEGNGPVLLLLHGLFGALSNWQSVLDTFSKEYRVIIPLMPIYEKSKIEVDPSVEGMAKFIAAFLEYKNIKSAVLVGNSLGGHIALKYTLAFPETVRGLVLTGSSGLYETGMGNEFPKYKSYPFIKERVEFTFYSKETASKDLVDEVFGIVNDNYRALRVLRVARSAQRENLTQFIPNIKVPTLLVWGLNDNITPCNVAHEFHKLISNSKLRFIDKCGHAAMMEQPEIFNQYLIQYLHALKG